MNSGWNKDFSVLQGNGPNGRPYWFLFEKLEKTVYYDSTPRLGKEVEVDMINRLRDVVVVNDVTIGDFYDNSSLTGVLPLFEWTFERWHFQRILTLGDAAHKASRTRPSNFPFR